MPIIKSAIKRSKQSSKRRERNIESKRALKVATKDFLATPSATTLAKAQSELDKAVKKGLLKKNTAARRKARLARIAKEQGVTLEKSAKVTPKKTATAKKPVAKKVTPEKKPATKKAAAAKKPVTKKPAATKKSAEEK